MQIGVYGSGYLGTVISACLADFGTPVTCCHPDSSRMVEMAQGNVPFFEKNLNEVIRRNVRCGRLVYSTDIESFARKAQFIFLAEDSPQHLADLPCGLPDLPPKPPIMSIVTPVSVGTATADRKKIKRNTSPRHHCFSARVLYSGCAVEDFNWPDRILLGTSSNEAVLMVKQIFHPLVMRGVPVIVTNHETAELAREAATAFVATKISFINELASLCETRGRRCLEPLAGSGAGQKNRSTLPAAGRRNGRTVRRDRYGFAGRTGPQKGVSLKVLSAAREVNLYAGRPHDRQDLRCHRVAAEQRSRNSGLAFKPQHQFGGGSSLIPPGAEPCGQGRQVRAYDPVAIPDAKLELNGTVHYCDSAYAAAEGVDALVVGTGWPEFRGLDFDRIKHLLKRPLIVDTKNLLDSTRLRTMGFEYVGVGRGHSISL